MLWNNTEGKGMESGITVQERLALTATSLMWGGKGKARALFAAIYSTIRDLGKDSCLHRQIYQWVVVAILLLLLLWRTERMSSQMNLSMASHSFIILEFREKTQRNLPMGLSIHTSVFSNYLGSWTLILRLANKPQRLHSERKFSPVYSHAIATTEQVLASAYFCSENGISATENLGT